MADIPERLFELLQKRSEQELSFEEQAELHTRLDSFLDANKRGHLKKLIEENQLAELLKEYQEIKKESDEIADPVLPARLIGLPARKRARIKWTVAASILLVMAVTGYLIFNKSGNNHQDIVTTADKSTEIVLPGTNSAILKLSDGRQIVLDSTGKGVLAQLDNLSIISENGNLKYELPTKSNGEISYNTLETSAGQTYSLTLSDGTKIWLNACSSLYFPTNFSGNTREVILTGEGYFEIARNKQKPFYVNTNGMKLEVLGTSFNVNAYTDEESIKTSLLTGSVRIVKGNASEILKPGQQGILTRMKTDSENFQIEKRETDMNEVVAWKNGLFQFSSADITTIMRQIGRWYNVKIVYAGKVPQRRFEGKISRDAQLADVLEILELSNVKFTVEGKKIIVQ